MLPAPADERFYRFARQQNDRAFVIRSSTLRLAPIHLSQLGEIT